MKNVYAIVLLLLGVFIGLLPIILAIVLNGLQWLWLTFISIFIGVEVVELSYNMINGYDNEK